MELGRLVTAILHRVYLLVVGAVMLGALLYVWSARQPIYHVASAQIVVTLDEGYRITTDRISYVSKLAQQYAEIPVASTSLQLIEDEVPSRTPDQIAAELHLTWQTGQPSILVSARDIDQATAISLANVAARTIVLTDAESAANQHQVQIYRVAGLQAELAQTSQRITATQAALSAAQAKHQSTATYLQTLTTLEAQQSAIMQQLTPLETSVNLPVADFWVSQLAMSAAAERSSATFYAALGGMVGLLVGLGAALLLDLLDDVVRTSPDTLRFAGLRTLGAVPDPLDGDADEMAVLRPEEYARVPDEYEDLLRSLGFLDAVQRLQVLFVVPADNATHNEIVGLELAAAYAQAGLRTLLIDANWDMPSLDTRLGLPYSQRGLFTSIVAMSADPATADDAVHPTALRNLFVMPVGPLPPNLDDLMRTSYVHQWLTRFRSDYAQIVLVAPARPVSLAGQQLAEVTDGALVVANAGMTRGADLADVARFLRRSNANLVGVALISAGGKPVKRAMSEVAAPEAAAAAVAGPPHGTSVGSAPSVPTSSWSRPRHPVSWSLGAISPYQSDPLDESAASGAAPRGSDSASDDISDLPTTPDLRHHGG